MTTSHTRYSPEGMPATHCRAAREPGSRYQWLLVLACVLTLPGCSGCQKKAPEPPPQAETPAKPPAEPLAETATDPATQSAPKPAPASQVQAAPQPAEPSAPSAAEPSKPPGPEGRNSQIGASSRPPKGTKPGTPTDPAASTDTGRPPQTAAAALEKAEALHKLSEIAAGAGKYGRAFQFASDAWEAVHAFPGDSQCQALCKKLETELELMAERANAIIEPDDARTKKLVDQ